LFTDTTQLAIVSFPYKCNAALRNVLWKGQKTVGCLFLFCSLLSLASWGVTHFILTPLHFLTVRFCTHRFQSKQLIFARMQGNMSFVADSCFLTSALKSHIISSQCQPFGKLQDSRIYGI
jgi:hypothetical protein